MKLSSLKLAREFMKRVTKELESNEVSKEDNLLVQGVRFAFRVHQVGRLHICTTSDIHKRNINLNLVMSWTTKTFSLQVALIQRPYKHSKNWRRLLVLVPSYRKLIITPNQTCYQNGPQMCFLYCLLPITAWCFTLRRWNWQACICSHIYVLFQCIAYVWHVGLCFPDYATIPEEPNPR